MSIQFWRSKDFSDESFLDLIDRTFGVTFTGTTEARTWLKNNGYFTSYPDIVDDGLVLHLDTQNKSSFRGEPTTNIAYSYNSALNSPRTWVNSGAWISDMNSTDISPPNISYVDISELSIMRGEVTTAGSIHFGYTPIPISSSTTYTMSVWFRQTMASGTPYMRGIVNNVNLGNFSYNGSTNSSTWPLNEWIRIICTQTTPADETQIFLSKYIGTVGETIWYFGFQIEQKDHATYLALGTRGATFETDGGWLDLSGNNNHADLSNMTFDSDGMVYNSGQYIDTGYGASINMLSNPISFCCWVKTDSISATVMYLSSGQSRGTGDSNARFYFGTNSGHWTFGIQTSTWSSTVGPTVNSDWTHVACSMTGTYARFFVNGVFDRQKSYTSYSLNDNINLGRHDANYYWDGKISSLQIYNTTLTDNEVLSNFNGTKTIYGL